MIPKRGAGDVTVVFLSAVVALFSLSYTFSILFRYGMICKNVCEWRYYGKKCHQQARVRGVAVWRWYSVPWLGFLSFVSSVFLFLWVGLHSAEILMLGMVLWGFSFLWQTRRKGRWCAQAMCEEDSKFVRGRVSQLFVMYLVPLYVLHYVLESNAWIVSISFIPAALPLSLMVLLFGSQLVAIEWFRLWLGERSLQKPFRFWPGMDRYGFFGELSWDDDLKVDFIRNCREGSKREGNFSMVKMLCVMAKVLCVSLAIWSIWMLSVVSFIMKYLW